MTLLEAWIFMIRPLFAFLTLLMLTFTSAAFAHEHGMAHKGSQPAAATMPAPPALPISAEAMDRTALWVAVADASTCADTQDAGHNHGKLADCTCPAACAGLFHISTVALPSSVQVSADIPFDILHLSATSAAPPTPPPRA